MLRYAVNQQSPSGMLLFNMEGDGGKKEFSSRLRKIRKSLVSEGVCKACKSVFITEDEAGHCSCVLDIRVDYRLNGCEWTWCTATGIIEQEGFMKK